MIAGQPNFLRLGWPCGDQRIFWYSAAVVNVSPDDAPAALIMGVGFLAFGLTLIVRPSYVRANLDRFAGSWKQGSWHPFRMSDWGLRLAGMIGIAGATLFFHIAYLALHH